MSKTIAITNQKGGVGKTTTSVNLAACLAYKGKKVLLIDSDPQGNTTSGYGIERDDVSLSIYDCLVDSDKIEDAIIHTKYRNLDLIAAGSSLSGAEIELAYEEEREYFLLNALKKIKNQYDFILIDSPPALGILTLNILTAADSVLIPIQCEYYALEGLSQLMSTIRLVKKRLNPKIEIEGVLATMFDARTNLSIQVLDEVKKFFPSKVYQSVIPRNIRLSEAPSFGEPIIKYDITSKGAESYLSLAREVISMNE
jgi:chromosome partitioning protein